ncbi:uncharacterized protein P884DRAFT_190899 [Thermothelomyces heterothallicus CBS 202.75]|uniref:uncharacterized protein n=1 Tax=Thermothelomyces heterothallicus CBS 202.75 TaxID=1149848 RepID=UPI003744215F
MLLLPGRPLPSLSAPNTRAVSSVADASFWKSLVPKPLRSPTGSKKKKSKVQKGWNPATFFIIIFLLIGSMAIQMISLRKDFATFMRQSGVKIDQLREVVEKLQRGEEVDVEEALGTGDAKKELEWEQVLREIEREEPIKNQRKKQPDAPPNSTPTPSSGTQQNRPASQETRAPLQSTLASKGFF